MIPGTLDAGGPLWGWDWDSDDDWDLAVLALLALAVVAATALALHWFGSGQDHEVGQPASTAPRAQPPQAGDKLALHPKSKASGGGLEQQSPGQGKPEAPGQDQKSSATAGAQDQKPSTGRGMAPTDGLPLKTLGRVISRGVSGQQQANSAPGAPQDKERECSSPDSALLVRSKARGIPAPLLIHFTPRSPGSKMEAQVQEGGTGTKESACQAPACAEQKDTSSWHLSVKAPGSRRRDEGNFQWWLDSSSRDRTSHAPKPDPLRLGAAVSVWDVVDGAFKATQDSQAHSPCKSPPLPYSTPEPSGQDLTGASTTQIQLGANSSEDRQGGSNVQSSPTRAVCSGVKTKESRETGSSALRETQRVEAREGGWTWAAKEPALISSSFSCVPGMTGVAADSAVTSRSSLVPEEPSLHLSKGSQKGQVSTSWGNLIAMVLRSHPFPRQEQAQGSAPKAVPGTSPGPSTLLHAEDKQPSSLSEVPIPSPQDRCISSLGKGTKAGSGDLAETGCQPQSISFKTNGIPISSSLPGGKGDGTKEKTLDLLSPATMPTPLLQPSKETQPSSVPSSTTRQDSQPISRLQKGSICEIVQKSELVTTQTGPGKQRQVPAEGPSPADSREILREKQKEAQKLMFFLQRPGSWGVVEGLQKTDSRAATEAPWPRQVDLSNCLEVLAFAQQHGEPGLAQETYAVMSNNLLRVLGDPHLYRQLSGADRERILNLRTCQGQTVLGVLVLPSLYQVSRSGLGRPSPGEEAAAAGPAPLPPLTHLHVFIPQENSWRLLTQVPEEAPLRGCGLCTMHNYLFLAGGIRGSGTKAVCSNQVFCYNPLTNIWSQVRPMQQARAQLKLVALEGQLYAIGGECLYSMERYDPRTDTWTLRAPLPEGTFPVAHEAVACRGDIYVTGGHLFYRLLRYSPIKDLWVECPYSASHRRSSDMVALGGFLYRFDLLRGVGAAVMRYNTVTGSWSRAASLPLPDPAPLRCTVLGNTIYCLNHQVTATFTVSEGTAQFQAKELQPFPLGSKGILCPFTLTLPTEAQLQTAL
ncbi:kelch domain-containing protein 7B [Perognathus longimembris pacificus]|uniref:kelch domain-containing protein 7B n=1 Tax=Perognathus longimembris pacificus TaxID=214514 RepID=UPI0020185FA3|nr:kelch domain-containing protein 7B [Perognathus longimembris pacificus]